MRERKFVKFRVDMYSDTKFKIIDRKPERDLIHYVWSRVVLLCGKVNLEGDLYLSKNIPYTIETLAIEFNRDIDQIKLALDVLIELEMIEFIEDKIYRVKNFAKHQNIKIKEKIECKDQEENIKNKEDLVSENFKSEIDDNIDKVYENKISKKKVDNTINYEIANLENSSTDIDKIHSDRSDEKNNNNLQGIIPILLETKKKKPRSKKKKNKIIEEENEDDTIPWFSEGEERPLAEGECVTQAWSFS